MDDGVKMDILIAGLVFIPAVILFAPIIKNRLAAFAKRSKDAVASLPISAFLIYQLTSDEGLIPQIGLGLAYLLFFITYGLAVALLASSSDHQHRNSGEQENMSVENE